MNDGGVGRRDGYLSATVRSGLLQLLGNATPGGVRPKLLGEEGFRHGRERR